MEKLSLYNCEWHGRSIEEECCSDAEYRGCITYEQLVNEEEPDETV